MPPTEIHVLHSTQPQHPAPPVTCMPTACFPDEVFPVLLMLVTRCWSPRLPRWHLMPCSGSSSPSMPIPLPRFPSPLQPIPFGPLRSFMVVGPDHDDASKFIAGVNRVSWSCGTGETSGPSHVLPQSVFLPMVGDTFLRPPSRVSRWFAGVGL